MSDFTSEDLFEAADRAVMKLLEAAGVAEPPIDAVALLVDQFGYHITRVEEAGLRQYGDRQRPYGDRPRVRPRGRELRLPADASEESQHTMAARAVAKHLIPEVLQRLGIVPGTENRSAQAPLIGLLASRLLLPTSLFAADARRSAYDLIGLKERYATAGWEMIAWRMLEVDDEPAVVAIVDDGAVAARRGNRQAVPRALTEAERVCVHQVQETEDPALVRRSGWTAQGWPTTGVPYRRIIVRSRPDEV